MMKSKTVITAMIAQETLSFTEVCSRCDLSEQELMAWLEQGLLGEFPIAYQLVEFNEPMILRLSTANRLQKDLEVNLSGVVLALELLDKINHLQDELAILRRHTAMSD